MARRDSSPTRADSSAPIAAAAAKTNPSVSQGSFPEQTFIDTLWSVHTASSRHAIRDAALTARTLAASFDRLLPFIGSIVAATALAPRLFDRLAVLYCEWRWNFYGIGSIK